MNAFATGARRDDSLVAVSSGLLYSMSRDEAEAVLAHEVSHVANGDMVTLTLIRGGEHLRDVLRPHRGRRHQQLLQLNNEESSSTGGFAYMITVFVLEMVFGVLASIIVMWFSRQREFRADAGAAKLASRDKMIAALSASRPRCRAADGGFHDGVRHQRQALHERGCS